MLLLLSNSNNIIYEEERCYSNSVDLIRNRVPSNINIHFDLNTFNSSSFLKENILIKVNNFDKYTNEYLHLKNKIDSINDYSKPYDVFILFNKVENDSMFFSYNINYKYEYRNFKIKIIENTPVITKLNNFELYHSNIKYDYFEVGLLVFDENYNVKELKFLGSDLNTYYNKIDTVFYENVIW